MEKNAFLEWARDKRAVREWQKGMNLPQILGARPNCRARGKRERGSGVLVRLRVMGLFLCSFSEEQFSIVQKMKVVARVMKSWSLLLAHLRYRRFEKRC